MSTMLCLKTHYHLSSHRRRTYPSVRLDQLPKRRRRIGVPTDLDKLDAQRVGMVWACFDLIPDLDEHLGELVRVVVV